MHYNFCRIHKTLRVTPAMEAGLTDHVWTLEEVALLLEARNMEAKDAKRGWYGKKLLQTRQLQRGPLSPVPVTGFAGSAAGRGAGATRMDVSFPPSLCDVKINGINITTTRSATLVTNISNERFITYRLQKGKIDG